MRCFGIILSNQIMKTWSRRWFISGFPSIYFIIVSFGIVWLRLITKVMIQSRSIASIVDKFECTEEIKHIDDRQDLSSRSIKSIWSFDEIECTNRIKWTKEIMEIVENDQWPFSNERSWSSARSISSIVEVHSIDKSTRYDQFRRWNHIVSIWSVIIDRTVHRFTCIK